MASAVFASGRPGAPGNLMQPRPRADIRLPLLGSTRYCTDPPFAISARQGETQWSRSRNIVESQSRMYRNAAEIELSRQRFNISKKPNERRRAQPRVRMPAPTPANNTSSRSAVTRSRSWTIWTSFPPQALSSSAPSPRCAMALDIPHAFLPSTPRHKFPCVCSSKFRLRCTLHAPAAYNPPGAPHAGAFL